MKDSFEQLVNDIRKCRKECPWMKKQTLEKQKKEVLLEAQEVAEAIDKKDYGHLKEELGDLLYDTLHLIEIGVEKGFFTTKEVIEEVNAKIRRRKPWVFGDAKVKTAEEAAAMWNKIKQKEKKAKNNSKSI